MKLNDPIGIFDSGVGGTSIWKEIHQQLPFENTIYLADSRNAPYGNKSSEEILQLSIKNTEELLKQNCKLIVVACNTATTNAISFLRERYKVPFIGIEPAIKPAALKSRSKSIGILATRGTLSSVLFHKTSEAYANDISVVEIIGEGLVPLIERGELDSPELIALLQEYISPMLAAKIDYLVLGCSHYPYLIPQLKKLLPKEVTIIDSGAAVAQQTQNLLTQHNILRYDKSEPKLEFYSNLDTKTLEFLLNDYSEKIKVIYKEF